MWRWDQAESFGDSPADENPSGLGTFDLPLRLPGRYYDAESGLHYNYYRDYDPGDGRYVQSDPIGLMGGGNSYAYAFGSPLVYFDARGQDPLVIAGGSWVPLLGGGGLSLPPELGQLTGGVSAPVSLPEELLARSSVCRMEYY